MVSQQRPHGRSVDLPGALREDRAAPRPAPGSRGEPVRPRFRPRVGRREVKPPGRLPPALTGGERLGVGREPVPVRRDAVDIADPGAAGHPPHRPLVARGLQNERLARVGDEEAVVVRAHSGVVGEPALAKARVGIYPESISKDVVPERLRRFFHKIEGGYQIAKFIRDSCVFARQNVTKDPPFSRLDLITCRNLLIYLGPVLQSRVMRRLRSSKLFGFHPRGVSWPLG